MSDVLYGNWPLRFQAAAGEGCIVKQAILTDPPENVFPVSEEAKICVENTDGSPLQPEQVIQIKAAITVLSEEDAEFDEAYEKVCPGRPKNEKPLWSPD